MRFLRTLTNGRPGRLARPLGIQMLQNFVQGQTFWVLVLVMLEFLTPLVHPGTRLGVERLWLLAGALAGLLVVLWAVSTWAYLRVNDLAYRVGAEGRLSLGEHLGRLSMGFFSGRDPGDLTAHLLQDHSNLENMLSQLLMRAVATLVLPLTFLLFLVPLDPVLALVALVPLPLALAAALGTRALVLWMGRDHHRAKNDASSRLLEYLDGMKTIKAHHLEGSRFGALQASFHTLMKQSIRLEAGAAPLAILGGWILKVGLALILVVGLDRVIQGTLPITSYLVFLVIGARMYDPLIKVLIDFVELSYYSLSAGRIAALRDQQPLPEAREPRPPQGAEVVFDRVTFAYQDAPVLDDVTFTVAPGTMTALVGPSGSGKTTVTRLLARFWDVGSGQIRLGGVPLADIATAKLMDQVSLVFQDVYLFNDTVHRNIALGKAGATRDEVEAAARRARCHEFVSRLPAGYDTVLGEGGSTLSGGERQRLSIARAILKDAPVVLLDEATSSLDPENERDIQQALAELTRHKTLIVIAHRLPTIVRADQILVLDQGRIVERGTHAELLAREGRYRQLWDQQNQARRWTLGPGRRS